MSPHDVQHFLLVHDISAGVTEVEAFGRDDDAALGAYRRTEARYRGNRNFDVVLLGSDSRETLERTHASYFGLGEKHVDRIVARELADFGLR